MFKDSNKQSLTLLVDFWSTDRKTVDTRLEYRVQLSSAPNKISPKCLIVADETAVRIGVPNKANNVAVFDNLNVRKHHADIDGACHPRDAVNIDYASNQCVDQCGVLKSFYKDYVGEELLNNLLRYFDKKTKHSIQVIDLRFLVNSMNEQKKQLIEEFRGATNIARLFTIMIRHRETKMLSDGYKITEIEVI